MRINKLRFFYIILYHIIFLIVVYKLYRRPTPALSTNATLKENIPPPSSLKVLKIPNHFERQSNSIRRNLAKLSEAGKPKAPVIVIVKVVTLLCSRKMAISLRYMVVTCMYGQDN